MKSFMIFTFGIGALWDGFTTMIGIAAILKAQSLPEIAMCFVGGLMVAGFGLGTKFIFANKGFVYGFIQFLWLLCIGFDFYTSFAGNAQYLVLRTGSTNVFDFSNFNLNFGSLFSTLELGQVAVLLVLTILISSSPILISYLVEDLN
jgi:hypothetical protein